MSVELSGENEDMPPEYDGVSSKIDDMTMIHWRHV